MRLTLRHRLRLSKGGDPAGTQERRVWLPDLVGVPRVVQVFDSRRVRPYDLYRAALPRSRLSRRFPGLRRAHDVRYRVGMQLTDEDVREFQGIWKEEFNEDLAADAARHHASQLLELYSLLAGLSKPEADDGQPDL